MHITVTTNEQRPYMFERIKPRVKGTLEVVHQFMPTGDYGTLQPHCYGKEPIDWRKVEESMPGAACIVERKSLADLYSTLAGGEHRNRFEWQLERMKFYGHAAIVVEAEMSAIVAPNKYLRHPTKLNPISVMGSLIAYVQRCRIGLWMAPGRRAAEMLTYRILERWWRDHSGEGNQSPC